MSTIKLIIGRAGLFGLVFVILLLLSLNSSIAQEEEAEPAGIRV
jgi:hypothetical protein